MVTFECYTDEDKFIDYTVALDDEYECFYIETYEKNHKLIGLGYDDDGIAFIITYNDNHMVLRVDRETAMNLTDNIIEFTKNYFS